MPAITTVGALRGCTAMARAIDPVQVVIYLPGVREPIYGEIAGHILRKPDESTEAKDRTLTLQVYAHPSSPVPTPEAPQ